MNRCDRHAVISVFTLIRTDTTLDHSQKAEKVYILSSQDSYGKTAHRRDCDKVLADDEFGVSHSSGSVRKWDPCDCKRRNFRLWLVRN